MRPPRNTPDGCAPDVAASAIGGDTRAVMPRDALADVLACAGLLHADDISIAGRDPVLPTEFLLGTAAGAALAAVGAAASELWSLRAGRRQRVRVDLRAAAAWIRSERYVTVNGARPTRWDPISGMYRTRDARWIQLHCNFPHHRDGTLALLGAKNDPAAVAAAVASHDGLPIESALVDAGLCAALVRTRPEWQSHPQAAAVAALPLFEVIRIADAAPALLPAGATPLDGVRVLDLTRVIAGPVAGRTLAQHGADVLRITAPHLPDLPGLEVDTGIGKLAAHLDLRAERGRDTLRALLRDADVFVQGYRPETLAMRGFSPDALVALRPGLVYVSLSAWSHVGPWRARRGFDSLVQSTTGIVHEHTLADRPEHLPAQILDHVSGYLMAFGAMAALARRAREGGSWLVRVSLLQTAEWLQRLGRVTPETARRVPEPTADDIADLLEERDTPFGRVRHVMPVVELSETPAAWTRPPVPAGTHDARWPARRDPT